MSAAAVEQRLRRLCSKKKSGALKVSQEVYDLYHNKGADARTDLLQNYQDVLLNKEPYM